MPIKDILKIPYIMFVIGMLDAPGINYDDKKKNKITTPKTAQEQMSAISGALS